MPAWIPGSYMIRDFAKNIVQITARSGERALPLEKIDKQCWRAGPCSGPLEVDYQVYAWDLSVRGAHADATHAYFNGTSLFLAVQGREREPVTAELVLPEGESHSAWRVATTLPRRGALPYGFGLYGAADYDELVDHPVEMGEFTLISFEACGIPHDIALTGRHYADGARLAEDLKRICEYQIRLFGEPAPMERYLFQVTVVGEGYGGLEHRASTTLLCSRHDLPAIGRPEVSEAYRTFLGLCSHEYFHLWNVKRIKPAAFIPYDLTREVHTPLLWFFEGFTAYYDDLTLVRCGLIDTNAYLELLGQNLTRLTRSLGRFKQTVAESSFDAWTKFYKADENAPNAVVSYYVKGAVVALALDLLMRERSGGERTLDHLMRALWERHGNPGVGVTEAGIEVLASEVAGFDLSPFFAAAVRDTRDIDLAPLLATVGVEYRLRRAESQGDKGGKRGKEESALPQLSLGVRSAEDPLGARVVNVFEGGAAHMAGISPADILIAIDGLRVTHGSLERALAPFTPGAVVHIYAFRRDELMEFDVTLQSPAADTVYLLPDQTADATRTEARNHWLNGCSAT